MLIVTCSRKEEHHGVDQNTLAKTTRIESPRAQTKLETEIEKIWKIFATGVVNHDFEVIKKYSLPRIQLAIGTTDGNEYDRSVSIDYFLKYIFNHVFDAETKLKLLDSSKLHFSENDAKNIGGAYWNGLIPKNSEVIEEVWVNISYNPDEDLGTTFVFCFVPAKQGLKFCEVISVP
jgi:hypothetical protein